MESISFVVRTNTIYLPDIASHTMWPNDKIRQLADVNHADWICANIIHTLHNLFIFHPCKKSIQTPLCDVYLYSISRCADLYCPWCHSLVVIRILYGAFRPFNVWFTKECQCIWKLLHSFKCVCCSVTYLGILYLVFLLSVI